MTTRTARGTASLKTSGTTLTGASFTLPAGHSLEVDVGCENSQGPPTSVTMNGRPLKRKLTQNNAAAGTNLSKWIKARAAVPQTGVVLATWSSAIAARAMWASSFDAAQRVDQTAGAADTPTTTPATGTTAALETAVGLAVCSFVSAGPVEDTAATGQQIGGVTATLGQRAGTTGGVATSNVTIQETYLQLASAAAVSGNLSGVTQRRWTSGVLVWQLPEDNRAGVVLSDLQIVRDIFDGKGTPIPHERMAWYYNEDADIWEVYDRGASVEVDTLIAHYVVDGAGWVED